MPDPGVSGLTSGSLHAVAPVCRDCVWWQSRDGRTAGVGKSVPRRDIPPKVTGGVAYVQDLRLPGMVFGRVVRPPSYRSSLDSGRRDDH